jgi:Relaxase/Mobilisation nuclease domain
MIAKIMKSSASFQAVYYNEHKVLEQKASLLTAANFYVEGTNTSFLSRSEYIAYFQKISNQNSRVKNKQFHAVLSTKGQAHSAEELQAIGERYIQQMGYGENPYLIYFHQDTDHNHIHIVTTRVNKDGGKVDDSFEKKRSLGVIERIMQNQDRHYLKAQDLIQDIMHYQFTTEGQLKTLLELRGYRTQEAENRDVEIWKDNLLFGVLERQVLTEKLKEPNTEQSEQRAKQLKAIFLKYKNEMPEADFKAYLKEKLGVDIVFHKSQNAEKPFGYTIIDNAQKMVFKGSEVLKMSELFKNREGVSRQETVKTFMSKGENDKLSDYLEKEDLLLVQRGDELYLIDSQNDESHPLTEYKNRIAADLIMAYNPIDERIKENKISLDLNLSAGGEGDDETDRKHKRGIKR